MLYVGIRHRYHVAAAVYECVDCVHVDGGLVLSHKLNESLEEMYASIKSF